MILLGLTAVCLIWLGGLTLGPTPPRPTAILTESPTPTPTATPTPVPTPQSIPRPTPSPTPTTVPNPLAGGLPEPSARTNLQLLEASGNTLGDLHDHFVSALAKANYSAYAVYPFEQGFAVITRVEKCKRDGTLSSDRWANLDQTALPLSDVFSRKYWKRLFQGRSGDYRFFIFTFTASPPSFTGKETDAADAIVWQAQGPSVLPQDLRDVKIAHPFTFGVMVYQFVAAGDGTRFLKPPEARLGAWEELEGSKIVPSWKIGSVPSSVSFEVDHISLK